MQQSAIIFWAVIESDWKKMFSFNRHYIEGTIKKTWKKDRQNYVVTVGDQTGTVNIVAKGIKAQDFSRAGLIKVGKVCGYMCNSSLTLLWYFQLFSNFTTYETDTITNFNQGLGQKINRYTGIATLLIDWLPNPKILYSWMDY